MIAFYIILAASPVLLLGVVAFLVLIVIGVRKRDRGDLAAPAANRSPAVRCAGFVNDGQVASW